MQYQLYQFPKNLKYLNLSVINHYKKIFKNKIVLGLSDHTQGDLSVIAAVSMGARVVEKHFTDNNYRTGPDHKFSMNPKTWNKMVNKVRVLEEAIENEKKKLS